MAVGNVQINPLQYYKFGWTQQAADPANTSYSATIYQNQNDNVGVPSIPVPPNQIWKVIDVNIAATQTPSFTLDLVIGNTAQNININLNTTALALGTTRVNPFALMPNGGMLVGSATSLQVKLVSQDLTASTTAVSFAGNLGVTAFAIPKK